MLGALMLICQGLLISLLCCDDRDCQVISASNLTIYFFYKMFLIFNCCNEDSLKRSNHYLYVTMASCCALPNHQLHTVYFVDSNVEHLTIVWKCLHGRNKHDCYSEAFSRLSRSTEHLRGCLVEISGYTNHILALNR
jgi:hypothetical protein